MLGGDELLFQVEEFREGLVDSYPHLWTLAVGSDRKTSNTSGQDELSRSLITCEGLRVERSQVKWFDPEHSRALIYPKDTSVSSWMSWWRWLG